MFGSLPPILLPLPWGNLRPSSSSSLVDDLLLKNDRSISSSFMDDKFLAVDRGPLYNNDLLSAGQERPHSLNENLLNKNWVPNNFIADAYNPYGLPMRTPSISNDGPFSALGTFSNCPQTSSFPRIHATPTLLFPDDRNDLHMSRFDKSVPSPSPSTQSHFMDIHGPQQSRKRPRTMERFSTLSAVPSLHPSMSDTPSTRTLGPHSPQQYTDSLASCSNWSEDDLYFTSDELNNDRELDPRVLLTPPYTPCRSGNPSKRPCRSTRTAASIDWRPTSRFCAVLDTLGSQSRPDPDYLTHQTRFLNVSVRHEMILFIRQLALEYDTPPEISLLGIHILDIYLSKTLIHRRRQLFFLATCCIYLALKLEDEVIEPTIGSFTGTAIKLSQECPTFSIPLPGAINQTTIRRGTSKSTGSNDGDGTKPKSEADKIITEIKRYERKILDTLDWRINMVTPIHIIVEIARSLWKCVLQPSPASHLNYSLMATSCWGLDWDGADVQQQMLEEALPLIEDWIDDPRSLRYSPAVLALTAIHQSLPTWTKLLMAHAQIELDNEELFRIIQGFLNSPSSSLGSALDVRFNCFSWNCSL